MILPFSSKNDVKFAACPEMAGLRWPSYDDLILQLHEKLTVAETSAAPEVMASAPEALEAAWESGETPLAQKGDTEQQEPEEEEKELEEKELSEDCKAQIAALEMKVQDAMRRTARAQLLLRRKKAEELLLIGLVKHLKAACKVYQPRETEAEEKEENMGWGL